MKFYFLHISLFILSFSLTSLSAQEKDKSNSKIDTNYIVSYADVFTPRFILNGKSNEFTLRNDNPDSEDDQVNELRFKPNDPVNMGFGFTYKWLGINIAFPLASNDDHIYGKTKRFDLGTHFYSRKIIVDLNFAWYKGYYLANPQNIVPGWSDGDPYPSRADLKINSFGAAAFYIFKHTKFSYRSAFTFNERQKKSAGSAILGGGLSFNRIRADSSIISGDYTTEFDSLKVDKINLNNVYAVGGYAHNFVVKYFFLSLSLGLGFGVSTDKIFIENSNTKEKHSGLSLVSVFRASIGYNNDKYYVGLSMYNNGLSLTSLNNLSINYSNTNFNFYVGYRFYNLFKKKEPLPWLWDLKI